uniref:EexN family lipoprotein n=1 Tax=uncultured Sphingomonas sp. TaxID=158754 RepID=UPI0035CC2494
MVIVLSGLIALSACSDAKSVAHYTAHAAERSKRLDTCVAAADFSRDCRNVRQSQFDADGIPAHDGASVAK